MIIYNVTVKVEKKIAEEWLAWLKEVHIPEMMQTEMFNDYRVVRLLDIDDSEGPTYAIQYFASSLEKYTIYTENFEAANRQKSYDKWGSKVISFHSLMELVK